MSKQKSRSVLGSMGGLAASRLLCRVIALFTGLLVSRVLGPERLGLLSWGNLLISLAPFLTLGFSDLLVRRLPILGASGESATHLRGSVRFWFLRLGVFYALLLTALQFLLPGGLFQDRRLLPFFLVAFLGHFLFKLYYNDHTGGQRFRTLAILQVQLLSSRSLFVLPLLFLLPDEHRILSLYMGMGLSFVLVNLSASRGFPRLEPGWRAEGAGSLLREGAPIALYSLAGMLLLIGDRLVVSPALDPQGRGLFEQAVLLREAIMIVPSVLMTVMIPNYSGRVGAAEPGVLQLESLRQNQLLSLLGSLFFVLGALQLPWILHLLLPEYLPGLRSYQWTILAGLPLMIGYLPISDLISRGRSLSAALVALVSFFGLLLIDSRILEHADQDPLAAVIRAAFVVYCLYALSLLLLQAGLKPPKGSALLLLRILVSPVLAVALFFAVSGGDGAGSAGVLFAKAQWDSLLLLAGFAPWILLFEAWTGRLRAVVGGLTGKRKTNTVREHDEDQS